LKQESQALENILTLEKKVEADKKRVSIAHQIRSLATSRMTSVAAINLQEKAPDTAQITIDPNSVFVDDTPSTTSVESPCSSLKSPRSSITFTKKKKSTSDVLLTETIASMLQDYMKADSEDRELRKRELALKEQEQQSFRDMLRLLLEKKEQ
jgi:hypothetical protein